MMKRFVTALVAVSAISLFACAGETNDAAPAEENDGPTASESAALTSSNAAWCITHTFGLRFLSHASYSSPYWRFDVDNINGTYEGGAEAWSNGFCAHGIGVSAKVYGKIYSSRCCAP